MTVRESGDAASAALSRASDAEARAQASEARADEAIAAIRRCRPGAIETEGQERYIRSLA